MLNVFLAIIGAAAVIFVSQQVGAASGESSENQRNFPDVRIAL